MYDMQIHTYTMMCALNNNKKKIKKIYIMIMINNDKYLFRSNNL